MEALRTRILGEMLEKNKARDEVKSISQRLLQKEQELVTIKEQMEASRHDYSLL